MLLLFLFIFPFANDTWADWERFCAQTPYVENTLIPEEVQAGWHGLVAHGVLLSQDGILHADDANQACQNYRRFRQWKAQGGR